jgi:hypothetical protein
VSRFLRVVLVIIIAWLGLCSAAVAAEALPASRLSMTYIYDSHDQSVLVARPVSERGPPAGYSHAVTNTAVDRWSHGAAVDSDGPTPFAATTYNATTGLVQFARFTGRTSGQPEVSYGVPSLLDRWHVAAKTADEVVPVITKPYVRPGGATTPAQREAVQGQPCVDCGAIADRQVADHIDPLVKEYYRTGTIDLQRMRSIDAVQSQCPTCSAGQGAHLSRFSREMRPQFGLDP